MSLLCVLTFIVCEIIEQWYNHTLFDTVYFLTLQKEKKMYIIKVIWKMNLTNNSTTNRHNMRLSQPFTYLIGIRWVLVLSFPLNIFIAKDILYEIILWVKRLICDGRLNSWVIIIKDFQHKLKTRMWKLLETLKA